MIKTLFNYSLGLLSIILAVTQTCEDFPDFDYASHPEQPFDFKHLDLAITLEPELTLVRGVATYTVNPKINGVTQLVLNTEESAIDAVLINESDVEFEISNDSLIVLLPDSLQEGKEFELAVTWQSNSSFGLYLDSEGNFWSSKNPLAHRHWFPVFDHPRNELTFNAYVSIPYENEVLFNGEFVGDDAQTGNRKKIHYVSETPVPVTGLGFAMGDFLITEVTSGLTTIRLFSSDQKYTEEERIGLIREASQLKKDVERILSLEYPWEGLNIAILADNFWEERTHGSGTIFLYENMGSLSNQLKRGVYAQWFGEYLRGEQFFDFESAGDEMMRTALHFSLGDDPAVIKNPDTLNTIYSWNRWQESFKMKPQLFQITVDNSLPEIARSMGGIVSFEDYADVWYEKTGISWHTISFDEPSSEEEPQKERILYMLNTEYDEINSELALIFELQEGSGEELYSLNMTEFTFEDSINHEVNFTGELDTVMISISSMVEYIRFSEGSVSLDVVEIQNLPLFFLLNQLRSPNADDRRAGAMLLSSHRDNPDLQLALNDVMASEENASVRAALLKTMAGITNGATGTEQQFLDGLNSDNEEVQLVSLQSLANYPDNEMVQNSVRNRVLRVDSENLFNAALESYAVVASAEELVTLAERLQRVDSTGVKSLFLISNYPDADSANSFIIIAESYLEDSYPYSTRREALSFLLKNDTNQEHWLERLDTLLEDRDPRIRHSSLKAVKWLSPSEALKALSSVEQDEFDARILLEVDNLLEQLSE
ncbi:MAG: hypothetical protein JJ971_12760 [Balneolaceae bacterium]|nr:hypothetical protein [Balneolaceae bacterium]MBO6547277.1 hypothetical protein [Balneolaceae bacterium]MBO6647776.1 hypothetical protein [Balneolaceae bacterium]